MRAALLNTKTDDKEEIPFTSILHYERKLNQYERKRKAIKREKVRERKREET